MYHHVRLLIALDTTQVEIFKIFIDNNFNLNIVVSLWVFGALLIIFTTYRLIRSREWFLRDYEINEATIGIGDNALLLKPNLDDHQIAYKLWVELNTRKIGLPIDFDHDVIVEVYNSWYEFFKITRELIKEIPISKVRKHESTRHLVRIATDVLNLGLRPHLTTWQARFRMWYGDEMEKRLENESALFPQDIQKLFPEYETLTRDMREVNLKLIEYRRTLEGLWKEGAKVNR